MTAKEGGDYRTKIRLNYLNKLRRNIHVFSSFEKKGVLQLLISYRNWARDDEGLGEEIYSRDQAGSARG